MIMVLIFKIYSYLVESYFRLMWSAFKVRSVQKLIIQLNWIWRKFLSSVVELLKWVVFNHLVGIRIRLRAGGKVIRFFQHCQPKFEGKIKLSTSIDFHVFIIWINFHPFSTFFHDCWSIFSTVIHLINLRTIFGDFKRFFFLYFRTMFTTL